MNNLTVNQLARLLNTTKYTIRHYEDKGLLEPAFRKENGYKAYGENEIYRLAHILLLRNLHFSTDEIKNSLLDEKRYNHSFKELLTRLENELQELERAKKRINTILAESEMPFDELFIEKKTTRYFKFVPPEFLAADYSLNYKELAKHKAIGLTIYNEYVYLIKSGEVFQQLMYEVEEPEKDFSLESGNYLVKKILINDNAELSNKIEDFEKEIHSQKTAEKQLYITVRQEIALSILYNDSMVYSLEVRI